MKITKIANIEELYSKDYKPPWYYEEGGNVAVEEKPKSKKKARPESCNGLLDSGATCGSNALVKCLACNESFCEEHILRHLQFRHNLR